MVTNHAFEIESASRPEQLGLSSSILLEIVRIRTRHAVSHLYNFFSPPLIFTEDESREAFQTGIKDINHDDRYRWIYYAYDSAQLATYSHHVIFVL